MMRLPRFAYRAPASVAEAAELLASAPGETMLLAGGTDLLPNMKRRQQVPATLVGLRRIDELQGMAAGDGLVIRAGTTLAELASDGRVWSDYRGLWQAAVQVATPQLRNMGTVGGNLCLDTRCNYYDQNYEWRRAIDFCMKKDGETCWVAPSSRRCLAVSSTDLAPALAAIGARLTLVDAGGARTLEAIDLYRNDGIHYLARRPTEILTEVRLPPASGWRSAYWKLRRRGAFDFPVVSVAAAARVARDGTVEAARLVLGAVASSPLVAADAGAVLVGRPLDDAAIAEAAGLAAGPARPMDNTDFALIWRKRAVRHFVTYALRELRGDDVRAIRQRVARRALAPWGNEP
jgi:4-hydroxybenzoyl-CoA reductase subunit beta